MPSDVNAFFRRLMAVTATHHVDANGRLAIHSVIDSLQPMIEPPQIERPQVQRGILRKLCFTCVIPVLRTVNPWPDDQPLHALLRLSQFDEVDVCDLRTPRVVPTRRV